nr:(d)CMP kinase [Candidatus Levybacteria bacterium]
MDNKAYSIAIDGPVAAGKGTIAPKLARRLKGLYLYTGAMYRCVALFCFKKGVDLNNEGSVESILSKINIEFKEEKILLNNEDVTEQIKKEIVAMGSSKVALYKGVRQKLVFYQKEIAQKALSEGMSVVAEGRDTATKVLPNASLKIFLTAKPETRAKRRLAQIKKRGEKEDFKKVLDDVVKRDQQDSKRKIDPLVQNPENYGYFVLDNSDLSEKETIDAIVAKIKND